MTETERDDLLAECSAAGVVFHPKAGRLRPELTKGRPPDELLERVKTHREELLLFLAECFDWDGWEPPPLPWGAPGQVLPEPLPPKGPKGRSNQDSVSNVLEGGL
jgi:hypothetical protein